MSQYGTVYVLYDEQDNDCLYALKSDRYRFSEYLGMQVNVTGSVTDVVRELPVMNVTHVQLSPDR